MGDQVPVFAESGVAPSLELETPDRDVAAFHDLRGHDVLVEAEDAFLDARREHKSERQRRRDRVKQSLIIFHAALPDDGLEIRQMQGGDVVAQGGAVIDHEEAGHPAAAEDDGFALFRRQAVGCQGPVRREAMRGPGNAEK